ncbi:peptidyl-prolyl cis-trans isomerase [Streptomyces laurentii]|uniref:Peptidyl-prolyl cis-trans isomerase n=1 Tax=Streptomyces laurentii TaxID=39478 RepID=A0A169NR36_STRLU|nr:peptidyl-prolyl cis-trans isomerase [Streptomyces laurentii]
MLRRFLYVSAALLGAAFAFGSAVLGDWADENQYLWVSRACVLGFVGGFAVAAGCAAFAVLPRRWLRHVFPQPGEGQYDVIARRRKLPPIDGRGAGVAAAPLMTAGTRPRRGGKPSPGPKPRQGSKEPVSWGEVAFVAGSSWLVTGAGYGLLAAFDEPGLPFAPLLVLSLGQWVGQRHRDWAAASAAAVVGVGTLLVLLDPLRNDLGRFLGDALTVGSGATTALIAFALVQRRRARTAR